MLDLLELKQFRLPYLATPYTKYPTGIDQAAHDAALIVGRLKERGINVYSPIIHSHFIARVCGLDPLDYDLWVPHNEEAMPLCGALVVGMLDTWKSSHGVGVEMSRFRGFCKPIFLLDPATLALSRCDTADEYIDARVRDF